MENDPALSPQESAPVAKVPGVPSQKAQSWGALMSIIIIVLMIIVGAFYAWGSRIAQNSAYNTTPIATSTSY